MNKSTKIFAFSIITGIAVFIAPSQPIFAKSDTRLSVSIPNDKNAVALTDLDNSISLNSEDDGTFTISGVTNPNAKVTIERDSDLKDYTTMADSDGNFSKVITLAKHSKTPKYDISAKAKGKDDSSIITFKIHNQAYQSNKNAVASSSNTSTNSDNDQEPDINTKYDVKTLLNNKSTDLEEAVSLKDFYVVDVGADRQKQYHLLLTPSKNSDQYILAIVKKGHGRISMGDKVSLTGMLNGKAKINENQFRSGISREYTGQTVVPYLGDSYSVK